MQTGAGGPASRGARMAAVDLPIIPVIAGLVRANPGTISLGQGVVNYGPPVDVAAALQPLREQPALQKYQAVSGHAGPGRRPAAASCARKTASSTQDDTELMVSAGSNMALPAGGAGGVGPRRRIHPARRRTTSTRRWR